ncbi:MAG TPA: hypothetical protein VJ964_06470 [Balneolaceae bacterium]|nr:hypothetical protein [Balneolaceae bacterium]
MIQKIYSFVILFCITSTTVYSQESDSTSYGWLSFQTNIDTFQVVVDQNYANPVSIQGDSMRIETGEHALILVHPKYQDINTEITIKPNSRSAIVADFLNKIEGDSSLSSYKRITEGLPYNITINTDENSLIVIDDSTYGKGYLQTDIGPYKHEIKIKNPTARDRSKEIYINPSGKQKLTLFTKPRRSVALLLGFVPAASQWYKNEKIKGTVLTTLAVATTYFTLLKARSYLRLNNEYDEMLKTYPGITGEQKALHYGNLVEEKYHEVKKTAKIRDISLAVLISIYAYNIADTIFHTPKSGYHTSIQPIYISTMGTQTAGLKLKVSFQ